MSESQPSGPVQWGPPAAPLSPYVPPAVPSASMPLPPNTGASRFCVFCATPLANEALVCARCGRSQPQVTVPLPMSASMPLPYASTPYLPPGMYPPPQMTVFVAPAAVPQQAHRGNPTGMIIAALAGALSIIGFFFLPIDAGAPYTGPQLASYSSQAAPAICAAAQSYSFLVPFCSYETAFAPLLWALVALSGIALVAALVGWAGSSGSRKAAAGVVIACGIISMLIFGYAYFAGQSAVQTAAQGIQSSGGTYTFFAGLGTGGWLMIAGAVVSIIGGITQRASN